MTDVVRKKFGEFVCQTVTDMKGGDDMPGGLLGFSERLRQNPEKVAEELRYSLRKLAMVAEQRRIVANRTDVKPSIVPYLMERLNVHFLEGVKHPYESFAFEI